MNQEGFVFGWCKHIIELITTTLDKFLDYIIFSSSHYYIVIISKNNIIILKVILTITYFKVFSLMCYSTSTCLFIINVRKDIYI